MGALTFLCIIVASRLCVIYVREDNDSNYTAYIDYMDLTVCRPQKGC